MIKLLYITLGTISVTLGVIGIFVPGLPTTVFLLVAAWFYAKSSKRLYNALLHNRYLGKYIRNYRQNKGMAVKHKVYALVIMWVMILISVFVFGLSLIIAGLVLFFGLIGSSVILFYVPTVRNTAANLPQIN